MIKNQNFMIDIIKLNNIPLGWSIKWKFFSACMTSGVAMIGWLMNWIDLIRV